MKKTCKTLDTRIIERTTTNVSRKILLSGKHWLVNYFTPKQRWVDVKNGRFNIDGRFTIDGESAGAYKFSYDTNDWIKGTVPGDIRGILLENKLIDDPYYARNTNHSRWVESYDWWFRKSFKIPKHWEGKIVRLIFEGVDCEATYWLNELKLGRSKDMFVPVIFDISNVVCYGGDNLLTIQLKKVPESTADQFLDGRIPPRARIHKCQMSWGWGSWARHLVSCGIWDEVRVVVSDKITIKDLWVKVDLNIKKKLSKIVFIMEVMNHTKATLRVLFKSYINGKNFSGYKKSYQKEVILNPGENIIKLLYEIKNPKLWWPNGYGDQNLYQVKVRAFKGNHLLDECSTTFGIRQIKTLRNPGSPTDAYNLIFSVNGVKIFVKGGNWVPPDMLFGRIRKSFYERLIKLAQEANFNMFRVWGGGLIEKEGFYNLCDELGIMVWQEFPLSCSRYPRDKIFVEEKKREAEGIVRKLRNHPSLVLWCGGNELFYFGETSHSPVLQMFKNIVEKMHPDVDYHFSSPDKEREGERDHGPWVYQDHKAWNEYFRFLTSEIGCSSMPNFESLKKFIPTNEIWPPGQSYLHHFIDFGSYAIKNFPLNDLRENIFSSQFVQADSLKYAMEHCRRRQWKSSGCIYWQYNESWPTGRYSIVDYYTVPKMAFYWIKKACEPIHLSVKDKGWVLKDSFFGEVWITNETFKIFKSAKIEAKILDAKGKTLEENIKKVNISAQHSCQVMKIEWPFDPEGPQLIFLQLGLYVRNRVISSNLYPYTISSWKRVLQGLPLAKIRITPSDYQCQPKKKVAFFSLLIENVSSVLAFATNIQILGINAYIYLSDNYIFLFPGDVYKIIVRLEEIKDRGKKEILINVNGWNTKGKVKYTVFCP